MPPLFVEVMRGGSTAETTVLRSSSGTLGELARQQPAEVRWVYVPLASDVYSEALTIVVSRDGEQRRVRQITFGRP